jgi:hypothetical protein
MYSTALNMPLSPLPHSQTPWSIAVRAAYQKIYQIYHTGSSYVDSGNVEAHRLQQYGQSIIVDAYPILLLLTQTAQSESLPLEWVETIATEFTTLLTLVDERWMSAKDEYVQCILAKINLKFRLSRSDDNVTIPQPVHQAHTGKRGRPRKNVDPKVLHEAFQTGRRIPTSVLASILGISRATLHARKDEMGINSGYSDISDDDLDSLIQEYRQEHPTAGRSYIIGHLRAAHSLRLQRHRVVASVDRIDQLGQGLQAIEQPVGEKKQRTRYHVPRPNALWHIDGHHKLIKWGIVIHGVADGYSRQVRIRSALSDSI